MSTEVAVINNNGVAEGEILEAHTEQEENNFVKGLEDETQDFDPTKAQEKEVSHEMRVLAANGSVCFAMMTIQGFIQGFVHPNFSFDPTQAENVAEKLAPILVKYETDPPPWVAKYMDEFLAIGAIGTLGFVSYMQIKQLKAADIAKAKAQKPNSEINHEHTEAAA